MMFHGSPISGDCAGPGGGRLGCRSWITLVWLAGIHALGQPPAEPHTFFREHARLSSTEIAAIDSGRPVARILPSQPADTVFVLGVVYIKAEPSAYVKLATDISRLKTLPQYLGAGRFGATPALGDLDGFVLEAGDIRSLRKCKPGACDLQLPLEAIDEFRNSIDWRAGDATRRVNERAREMALEALRRYREGGTAALGAYRDHDEALNIAERFALLMGAPKLLGAYLPELHAYLLNYPRERLPQSESFFYWERVNFGLKPTLRLNHGVTYRGDAIDVVAIKQLYASHYFQVALDVTACVRDTARPRKDGFYLISLKGSKQTGLTGVAGSVIRTALAAKVRSSQEAALLGIKRALERE